MSRIYVALDLETTGLDPERDAIIEIGAVKFRDQEVLDTWSSLVRPPRPIPYKIQHLTGISQEEVDRAPPLRSLVGPLTRFVKDHPIIGHNVSFDLRFLNRQGLFLHNSAIDTFELAGILLPHAARYSLGRLAEELGISFPTRHRALEDALATKDLFLALLRQASQLPLSVIQEINRLAAGVDWPLRQVFRDLERDKARFAFTGSIGQQLLAKGALGGEGFLGPLPEEGRPLRPAPEKRPLDVDELAAMLEEGGAFAERFPGYEYRPQQVAMLRAIRSVRGIKKVFVASGLRYDLLLADKRNGEHYLKEIVNHHVSGQLKVAPEHSEDSVLQKMGKCGRDPLIAFRNLFFRFTRNAGKQQFLSYYIIAAHPGCTEKDMRNLASFSVRELRIRPEQVQIFTPTPSTYSTLMYCTETDPFTMEKLFVEKDPGKKEHQKRIVVGRPDRS